MTKMSDLEEIYCISQLLAHAKEDTRLTLYRSRKPAYSPTACDKCKLYYNSFDRQLWIIADIDSTRFFLATTFECLTDLNIRDNSLVIHVYHWRNKREPEARSKEVRKYIGTLPLYCALLKTAKLHARINSQSGADSL
jgi:hypothetical protein